MNYNTQSKKEQQYRSINELITSKKYSNYDSPYQSVNSLIRNNKDVDQVQPSIAWDNIQGGINLTYNIINGKLKKSTPINVYWANGTTYDTRIGDSIFCYNVPSNTPEGKCKPIHFNGTDLANNPTGATHLIATTSESCVGALTDVQVNYGVNADAATVWSTTIDIIKDGLRASGQPLAMITSTSRTPADQARIMFQNLVNLMSLFQ